MLRTVSIRFCLYFKMVFTLHQCFDETPIVEEQIFQSKLHSFLAFYFYFGGLLFACTDFAMWFCNLDRKIESNGLEICFRNQS